MKPRAFSANKTASNNNYSGSKVHRRLEKVKTQTSSKQFYQASNLKHKSKDSFLVKSRHSSHVQQKEPQQMLEENLNLKSFINNLQSQLSQQRHKFEINKRKNEKISRQMNRQFQKELYYSGKNPHSYLISGIKSQYDNMKSLYEQKSIEMNKILQNYEYTNVQEMKVYIEALERQNKNLLDQLEVYNNIRSSFSQPYAQDFQLSKNPKIYRSFHKSSEKNYTQNSQDKSEVSSKNVQVLTNQLAEQKLNLNRAHSIIEKYSAKLDAFIQEKEEQKKKIQFLEKLIIEKDNSEHEARRQLKQLSRQKHSTQQELAKANQLINSTQTLYKHKIEKLQEKQKKKFEIQREIFHKNIQEKNQYINKLEKEVRSLSAMLCYWKPLDQGADESFKEPSRTSSPNYRDYRDQRNSNPKNKMQSEHFGKESVLSDQSAFIEISGKIDNQNDRSIRLGQEQEAGFKRTATGNRSNSYQNALQLSKEKEKPRCECSKKYNQSAKKTRKIDIKNIKQIGELLRYRLIGHKIDIQKVKQLMDPPIEYSLNQFISMKTIKDLLKKDPFHLKEEDAISVSRYIVEDSTNEYVYWDQQNQINLTVAKSILKAFIGEYSLPKIPQVMNDWNQIKKIYQTNLMTALRVIAPKGVISQAKFLELLVGLGIQLPDELKDWLIGQIIINSSSLEELSYEVLQKL